MTINHDAHVKLYDAILWEQIRQQNYERELRELRNIPMQYDAYGAGWYY